MNDEQNGWNTAYTRGTLRRKVDTDKPMAPTNTDKLVPDGMEPGGSETDWAWYGAWYGAGAIAVVGMLAGLVQWMVTIWMGKMSCANI